MNLTASISQLKSLALKQLPPPTAANLAAVFNELFSRAPYCTELKIGASEPLYVPRTELSPAQIFSRADFPNSVLHEASHWCLAGEKRRQMADYGYWYEPDGRSDAKQRLFEHVEGRPQALEWCLSLASGVNFRVSCDNLFNEQAPVDLQRAVLREFTRLAETGLPTRAKMFCDALAQTFTSEALFLEKMHQILGDDLLPAY